MKLSESMSDLSTMVTLAGAMGEVDSSRMVFTQVPTRYLSGAEAGRVEAVTEEAEKLFKDIENDLPVTLDETPGE